MNHPTPTRRPTPGSGEQGYILVGVMFMLALLVIAMTVAAPKIAKSIQRDREVETMHRGKQYARAVKLYYKQFGAYPPNIDALVKTNEIRFLRKKYIDPTTGKDEWKVIHLGQNKAPTAFGFFGVPLNGAGGGGLCGNALPNSTGAGSGSSSSFGSSVGSSYGSSGSSFGSSSGSSFGSSGSSFGSSNPTAGCPSDTSGSGSSTSGSTASTDSNSANSNNSNGGTDSNAANGTNTASGTQTGSGSTATGTDAGSTSAFGQPGQTFGGAGIMGFSPNSPKQSILVYKKKTHYNEWEFVYDPIAEQMMMQGGQGGQGGNLGNNGLGTNPTGNNGFGGSTGIGVGGTGIGGGNSGIGGSGGGIGSPTGGSSSGGGSTTQPQQ